MKVLLVEAKGDGGLCHYSYNLAQSLAQAGCEVCYLTGSPFELEPFERAFQLASFPLRTVAGLRAALAFARTYRADIVHYQGANNRPLFERVFFALLKRTAKKAVYTCHVALPHEPRASELRFIGPKLRNADVVIVHSDRTLDEVLTHYGVSRAKTRMTPHGDYRFFSRFPRNPKLDSEISQKMGEAKVVLSFGGIREYKGLKFLIEAVSLLHKKDLDVRLMVVGKPIEPWSTYEALLKEHRLTETTYLNLNYVDMADVPSFFGRPDVVCLPYLSGSDSGVLQLASAFDKTIVASDVGGNRDAYEEGLVAEVVPPADSSALAEALERAFFTPNLSNSEKLAASRERRDWGRISKLTMDIYREALR